MVECDRSRGRPGRAAADQSRPAVRQLAARIDPNAAGGLVDLSLSTRTEGDRTVVEVGRRDRRLHRAAAARAARRAGRRRQVPPRRRHGAGRLPRLDRPRRAGRRPQAGARPRRLAAPGLHPGAHPQDLPDHRPRPRSSRSTPRSTRRSAPPSERVSQPPRRTEEGHAWPPSSCASAPCPRTSARRGWSRPRSPGAPASTRACSTRCGWRSARRARGRCDLHRRHCPDRPVLVTLVDDDATRSAVAVDRRGARPSPVTATASAAPAADGRRTLVDADEPLPAGRRPRRDRRPGRRRRRSSPAATARLGRPDDLAGAA